ncbi:hypothetical protein SL003B_3080 [Polymorphum gilvum SL003B-26A1]|uniref:Uncharacterized protein n=1 Tax=Polymorphum gilvum (strain LMG 25793 / CGMCC 1.9160 / SL003B-26A1) TaxID=991905 RepID=F2IWB8_POLGS|nr:hypothetical protein SL003B_3080 [Polymorphum gilvum SL003B-26A1]
MARRVRRRKGGRNTGAAAVKSPLAIGTDPDYVLGQKEPPHACRGLPRAPDLFRGSACARMRQAPARPELEAA